MVDQLQVLDVLRGKFAVPLGIFLGLQYVELLFPKSDEGGIYLKGTGYFTNTVIPFFWELYVH
jgi:hypothetical protein